MATTYVAFDLETTGLNTETDAIIEIGAVRFGPGGARETFQTLVNPGRPLHSAVAALTGISDGDLRDAPPLAAVASDFEAFIQGAVLVGQNAIAFDTVFLDRAGIRRGEAVFDTQELAAILLPGLGDYGLAALAGHFGINFPVRHRALADAETAASVFLALGEVARGLPPDALGQIAEWLSASAWPWRGFFREAWEEALAAGPGGGRPPPAAPPLPRPLSPRRDAAPIPEERPLSVLASAAQRPDVFEQFDERAEQRAMVEAVTAALNGERRLIIEAGTGTGKSLAYLIPAACYALANQRRVVISTATINLQEQLTGKDIPALQRLLEQPGTATGRPAAYGDEQAAGDDGRLRACQLKGRRNYLCLRRFHSLRASPSLSDEEALLASKVLVWLLQTETGDRAELRLGQAEEALWRRLSADGANCTADNSPFVLEGVCFLQRARRRAEGSHLVVVNHALLLSDIAAGGHVLPPYEHLVIDEAHHLEDEASRQFGFRASERDIAALLDGCEAMAPDVQRSLRGFALVPEIGPRLIEEARALRQVAGGARPRLREFAEGAKSFLREHRPPGGEQEPRLHLSRAMRVQPDWPELEVAWENLKLPLGQARSRLERLQETLGAPEQASLLNAELISAQARVLADQVRDTVTGIAGAVEEDDPQRVVWLECDRLDGELTVAWVPLAVDGILQETLYAGKRSVILTGATLRTQAGPAGARGTPFDYIQGRLGLQDADTVALGSAFDYQRAALLLLPRDMPEPTSPAYQQRLAQAITDLVRASQGRALALFTSHASLQAAHAAVSAELNREGITVLGQGIDGSPRQLVRALKADPATLVLGTASFWEGVDIPGEALSLLVMARLPFAVPTDPVFAARSALYDDPFAEYALPQAILRFKQGFGRLIRTKTDRGVLVVLDQRITSKQYGPDFLEAVPRFTRRHVALREMPALIERWLRGSEMSTGNPPRPAGDSVMSGPAAG